MSLPHKAIRDLAVSVTSPPSSPSARRLLSLFAASVSLLVVARPMSARGPGASGSGQGPAGVPFDASTFAAALVADLASPAFLMTLSKRSERQT